MKRICLMLSIAVLIATTVVQGQEIGAGVRFSSNGGFTGKFFLDQHQAIEAQLNSNGYGAEIVGLYEYHMNLSDPQWRWYFGGGAHIGSWNHAADGTSLMGIDGIIGIEYNFKAVPIGISLDFKPAFDFGNHADVFIAHNTIGLAGRYYFHRHVAKSKTPENK